MAFILNIDTSTRHASICLAVNETCLCLLSNDEQKDHASWLHTAIQQAIHTIGKKITDLDAVGITIGPGSYTGLRVGMATAKGLCYALNIPLVGVNTLEAMAPVGLREDAEYICPMIDARRMEVFTALYDRSLQPIIKPCAMILDKTSFLEYLQRHNIIFFGDGKNKFEQIMDHKSAIFKNIIFKASDFLPLIYLRIVKSEFTSLSSLEPLYLKEHNTSFFN